MNNDKNIFVIADDIIYDLNIKNIRDYITSKKTFITSKQQNNYRPSTLSNKLYSNANVITIESLVNLSNLTDKQIELLLSFNKEYILFILYLSYFNMIDEKDINNFFTLKNNTNRDKFILNHIGYFNNEYIIDEEKDGIIKYSFMESFDRALNEGRLQSPNNYSQNKIYNFNKNTFMEEINNISNELFLFDDVDATDPSLTINNSFNMKLKLKCKDPKILLNYFNIFYSENPFLINNEFYWNKNSDYYKNTYLFPNLIPIDFFNKHSIRCAYNKFLDKNNNKKRICFIDKDTQKSLVISNIFNSIGFEFNANKNNLNYLKLNDIYLNNSKTKYLSSYYYIFSMLDMSYDASLYLYLKSPNLKYKYFSDNESLNEITKLFLDKNFYKSIDSYNSLLSLANYKYFDMQNYEKSMSNDIFDNMNCKAYSLDGSSAGYNSKYTFSELKPTKESKLIPNSSLSYDSANRHPKPYSSHYDEWIEKFVPIFIDEESPVKQYYSHINNKDSSLNNKEEILDKICPQHYFKSNTDNTADRRYILFKMARNIFNDLLFGNENYGLNLINACNKLLYKLDPDLTGITKDEFITNLRLFISDSSNIDIDIRLNNLEKEQVLDTNQIKNDLIELNADQKIVNMYLHRLKELFKDTLGIELFKNSEDSYEYTPEELDELRLKINVPSIRIINLGKQFKYYFMYSSFIQVLINTIQINSEDKNIKHNINEFYILDTIKKDIIDKINNLNKFEILTNENVESSKDILSILYYYFQTENSISTKFYYMLLTDLLLSYCDYLENDDIQKFELDVNYYTYIVYRAIFLIRESLIDYIALSFNTDLNNNKIIKNINKSENIASSPEKIYTNNIPIYNDDLSPEEVIGTLYDQFNYIIKGDDNNV